MDLPANNALQQYIVENLLSEFGISKVIGPAGWNTSQIPGGGCRCPSSRSECRERIPSSYNVFSGRAGHAYAAYTLCGHATHIHLSFN
jgi:hypothetical protein